MREHCVIAQVVTATKHIGLIGGIGPAATAFYYQRCVQLFAEAGQDLSLTISHTSLNVLMKNMKAGDTLAQAQQYLLNANQLKASGADLAVITSFGGSFCADDFETVSPLPTVDGLVHPRPSGRRGSQGLQGVVAAKALRASWQRRP